MATTLIEHTCSKCGCEFEAPNHNHRKYCDACAVIAREDWFQSPARKAYLEEYRRNHTSEHEAYMVEYLKSPEHRKAYLKSNARYHASPKGLGALARAKTKFLQSPKGMAATARYNARRRDRSTNPDLFATRVELLHILRESCAMCRAPYERTHIIDHIKALCNGGIDEWSNYQPACTDCHAEKTKKDLAEFARR